MANDRKQYTDVRWWVDQQTREKAMVYAMRPRQVELMRGVQQGINTSMSSTNIGPTINVNATYATPQPIAQIKDDIRLALELV